MDKFDINRKLYNVFEDFKKSIAIEGNCCELLNFRYDYDNIANYNNSYIQQYYLLKYLKSYYNAYYTIYNIVNEEKYIDIYGNSLKVLSLGCGCGTDLWALSEYLQNINSSSPIFYYGLDKVLWDYWDNLNLKAYRQLCDIGTISTLPRYDYNIIIFPKSISEFSSKEIENFTTNILKNLSETDIVFIGAIRSSSNNFIKDIERFDKITSKLENYITKDTFTWDKSIDFFSKFHYLRSDSCYPWEIKDFLSSLEKKCAKKLKYLCYNSHYCYSLSRNPITTNNEISFKIAHLKRNQM